MTIFQSVNGIVTKRYLFASLSSAQHCTVLLCLSQVSAVHNLRGSPESYSFFFLKAFIFQIKFQLESLPKNVPRHFPLSFEYELSIAEAELGPSFQASNVRLDCPLSAVDSVTGSRPKKLASVFLSFAFSRGSL